MQRALSNGWLSPELIAYAQAERVENSARFRLGGNKHANRRLRGQQALRASAWTLLIGCAAFSYLAWSGTGSAVWDEWNGRGDGQEIQRTAADEATVTKGPSNATSAAPGRDPTRAASDNISALPQLAPVLTNPESALPEAETNPGYNPPALHGAHTAVASGAVSSQGSVERQVANNLLKDRVTQLREEHHALRESIALVQQQLLTLAEADAPTKAAPQEY
ncbi:MAG: hypothetical protein AAGG55_13545 [Pseudomonadota bacterium]